MIMSSSTYSSAYTSTSLGVLSNSTNIQRIEIGCVDVKGERRIVQSDDEDYENLENNDDMMI